MKNLLLVFWLFLLNGLLFSQNGVRILVLDKQTEAPLPFVKLIGDKGTNAISDIDGIIEVEILMDENYTFRFFEYKDTIISGENLSPSKRKEAVVFLTPDSQSFDEVVIRPGENPAHRIIKNAMRERKNNDPLRNNSFRYSAYAKFYLTANLEDNIQRDTIQDSSTLRLIDFMDRQYFFLTETASIRTFSPPSYDKEEVVSYKVSGVNNPMFATLSNQLQSFSFYENTFSVNEKEYINPIAPGSINRYLFILEDTTFQEKDTTFVIRFRPKKGKNFEGLKGFLYINTNGWAVERVIAEPFDEQLSFQIKIVQEYKFTAGKKWFPYKLSTEIEFPSIQINAHNALGRSNLYIKDVEFDVDVPNKRFNAIRMEVKEDAGDEPELLDKARGTRSSEKEALTYQVIDSIGKAENFEKWLDVLTIASTGKIPFRKVSFPLNQLLDFNQQEGYRLGLGIETNHRLVKWLTFGGYFAYGTRDKEWKWGGKMNVLLSSQRKIKLSLNYRDDVFERGTIDFKRDEFDLIGGSLYRNFFINQMDRERRASVGISGLVTPNMKLQLLGDYRRVNYFDDYSFAPTAPAISAFEQFDLAETSLLFSWNIREKVMQLGEQRVSLGTKLPKLNLRVSKGWDGIFDAQYDYWRLNFNVEQDFSIRGFGKLSILSASGATIGDVPITLAQMPFGTGKSWNLSVPNTFETMMPAEFFSDRQTALFTRLTLLPLKNKTKWTEPLISLHNAYGIGTMSNRQMHQQLDFKVHEKGFMESGIIIDNLLKSGFTGLGMGVFHRFGHYALEDFSSNFVYKISLRFNF